MKTNAINAARYLALPFQIGIYFALTLARKNLGRRSLSIKERARNAAITFLLERLAENKKPVHVNVVRTFSEETNVYNITLEKENVYYANGVLVDNCADSLMMALANPPEDVIDSTRFHKPFAIADKKAGY